MPVIQVVAARFPFTPTTQVDHGEEGAQRLRPYRAVALQPRPDRDVVYLVGGREISAYAINIALAPSTGGRALTNSTRTRVSASSTRRGPPDAKRCAARRVRATGGGNSAGQAAVWLACGGALATLLHRRADVSKTMSDYLLLELDRYGAVVRNRSEVAKLHGIDGELEAVTLGARERAPLADAPVPRSNPVRGLAR